MNVCERGRNRGGACTCINILKLTFINPVLWLVGLIEGMGVSVQTLKQEAAWRNTWGNSILDDLLVFEQETCFSSYVSNNKETE